MTNTHKQKHMSKYNIQYTTNTPFGLYRYNRMCFGVASSPAQFQGCMDSLVGDLPGVAAYLDDLIVTGRTEEKH